MYLYRQLQFLQAALAGDQQSRLKIEQQRGVSLLVHRPADPVLQLAGSIAQPALQSPEFRKRNLPFEHPTEPGKLRRIDQTKARHKPIMIL